MQPIRTARTRPSTEELWVYLAVARVSLGGDEVAGSLGVVEDVLGRHAESLHHESELISFILAGEEWVSGEEFREDAAEAPHVNGHPVLGAQNDLRRPVEAGLDVGVDALVIEAGAPEVDHLDWEFDSEDWTPGVV